jgi:hypothetical protein
MRVCRRTHRVRNRNGMPSPTNLKPPLTNGRTRQTFAIDTLDRLNVPITQNNVDALLAQFAAEEPPGENAANNPSNIEVATAQSHGDRGITGGWSIAPQIATFDTWANGIYNYANELQKIAPQAVADLGSNAPAEKTVQDIGASGWGTNTSTMLGAIGADPNAKIQGGGPVVGSGNLPGSTPSGGINDAVGGALSGVGGAITGAFSSIEGFALRAGKVLLGILLLVAVGFIAVKM